MARHHACATVQLRSLRGGVAASPCSGCAGKGHSGAGSGLLSHHAASPRDAGGSRLPAGPGGPQPGLGGVTEEGSDPLGAPGVLAPVWDSTGDKCPCRTIPSETGWTMLVGPGSPGRWHGSSRQHLSGTGHSSLSDSAAASSSLAPAAPDGKAVPGRLHPMTPRASPVIHPSHPKSSSTQGLTGQAGPRS